MTAYTLDYFIQKFEAIPEDQWTTEVYQDLTGAKCALGHCGVTEWGKRTLEADALDSLTHHLIVKANDGLVKDFKATTPKGRVLELLRGLKEAQGIEPLTLTDKLAMDMAVYGVGAVKVDPNQMSFSYTSPSELWKEIKEWD